jgi:sugar lactone lactonase YvrE
MRHLLFGILGAGLLVAAAHADILYVTSSGSNSVCRVDEATGAVTTFATGLNDPFGIVLAPNGNFYVANQANLGLGTISQITPNGVVSTFATTGTAPDGLVVDGSGNLFAVNFGSGTISKVPTTGTDAGVVTTYVSGLDEPTGIALSSTGALYVSEAVGSIYTISVTGSATLFSSPGENPTGMAFDSQSNLYVSGLANGDIYVYPHTGGGPNIFASSFGLPEGLTFDSAGNLIVANLGTGDGGGSSSAEISLLESTGTFIKNITGFADPAYIVALSGSATITPSAGANGSINPDTAQTVASGTSIGFTATANSGFGVNQWLLNGSVAQTGGTTFTISDATPNDTVQVTFEPVGPITPFPGVYDGLFNNNGGYITINLSSNGRFTGKVTVGSASHTLSGMFTSLGAWTGTAAGHSVSVSLQLSPGEGAVPGAYFITGSAGGATLTAWHAAEIATYTLGLTPTSSGAGIPPGPSAATLKISQTGSVKFSGKLPDGEPFNTSATIVGGPTGNQCLIYSILNYKNVTPAHSKGYLIGSITFPSGVVTGPLLWIKPTQTKGSFTNFIDTGLSISQ